MEFIDLKAQQKRIETSLRQRMDAVLAHGQYIMGPEVRELEDRLKAFCGAKHCVGCASGSTALDLVLAAWGVGPGDAIFTTTLSFIATAESIARTGAIPVFVDIDPTTFNIHPGRLAQAVQAVLRRDATLHPLPCAALETACRPRAVVPVDLFGFPADYDAILHIASENGLKVLEDAAQGFGGVYRGKPLCNCGCHAATTSFFPAKPLGCYGDGGAVFTNDDDLAALVNSLRYHGRKDATNKNENVRLGFNGRLDTLQAAILLAKMDIFEAELQERQEVAAVYHELLSVVEGLVAPLSPVHGRSTWAQYTVLLPLGVNREQVIQHMRAAGVPVFINYPKGMYAQDAFASLGHAINDFPVVQEVVGRVLSLPMHPYLQRSEQEFVVNTLMQAMAKDNI